MNRGALKIACLIGVSAACGLGAHWDPIGYAISADVGQAPTVVLDAKSNATVMWESDDGTSLHSAFLAHDSEIADAAVVAARAPQGELFLSPKVYADLNGNITAIWAGVDPLTDNLLNIEASFRDGGSEFWLPPAVEEVVLQYPGQMNSDADHRGNVMAGWLVSQQLPDDSTSTFVTLSAMPAGDEAWTYMIEAASEGDSSDWAVTPSVSVKSGWGLALWKMTNPNVQLQWATFDYDAETFSHVYSLDVSDTFIDIVDIQTAMNADGSVAALVLGFVAESENLALFGTTFDGTSWSQLAPLSNLNNSATLSSLTMDKAGNVGCVWVEAINDMYGNQFVASALLPAGSTSWVQTGPLSGQFGYIEEAQIACTSCGNLVAVWCGDHTIESAIQLTGERWSGPEVVTTSGVTPSLALNNKGRAMIVWQDFHSLEIMGAMRDIFEVCPCGCGKPKPMPPIYLPEDGMNP